MWRLITLLGALSGSSNALRGKISHEHQWNEDWNRRIQKSDERKHKKTDFPTYSPGPYMSPQPSANPTISPAPSSFPPSIPSSEPTSSPSGAPTSSLSLSPTLAPSTVPSVSSQPSPLPTTTEQKAACESAEKGGIFVTETSVTVRFLYELLSPANSSIMEVASSVDEKVQDFLVAALIDCSVELASVGGVGPGEIDTVVEYFCSFLVPQNSQVCHLMEGTIVLYLSSGAALTDEEGMDQVSEQLSFAFNGAQRSLQTNGVPGRPLFIDPALGILGLYYIGGRAEEEVIGYTGSSNEGSSKSIVPAIVIPIVVVAFISLVVIMFLVLRRRKDKGENQLRCLLLFGDDDTTSPPEERWKELKEQPLQTKVITTGEEDFSSLSSGGYDEHLATKNAVISDLSGYTVSESIELFAGPCFCRL